jgi:hypothetical protein
MTNPRRRNRRRKPANPDAITGAGDYKLPRSLKNIVKRAAASHVAREIANAAGSAVGARLGNRQAGARLAQKALAKISGKGDYQITTNSLVARTPHGPVVPEFTPDGKRGVRIREREYIGDIVSGGVLVGGSTTFDNHSFVINPANSVTFPWLSRLAVLFDQWMPNGIAFEYVSTSSAYNGTSQALGVVILATDYDTADPAYASKAEMENADYACSTAAHESAIHGIECDLSERLTRLLYTGEGAGSATSANLHNLGRFQIATQGMSAAGVTLGELWVTYDITFYKKQVHNLSESLPYSNLLAPAGAYDSFINGAVVSATRNAFGLTTEVDGPVTCIRFPDRISTGRYMICIAMTDRVEPGAFSFTEIFDAAECYNILMVAEWPQICDTEPGTGFLTFAVFDVLGPNALLKPVDLNFTWGVRSISVIQVAHNFTF